MAILIVILMIILPSLGVLVFSILALVISPAFWFLSAGSFALFLFFLLAKFRIAVRGDERLVVERNGIPRVLGPGRHWTIPVVDYKKKRIRTCDHTAEFATVLGKVAFGNIVATFTGAVAYLRPVGIFNTGAIDPYLVLYNDDKGRKAHSIHRISYFANDSWAIARTIIQDALTSTSIIMLGQGKNLEMLQRGVAIPISDVSKIAAIQLNCYGFCGDITLHITSISE